jgi:hypothetical protein
VFLVTYEDLATWGPKSLSLDGPNGRVTIAYRGRLFRGPVLLLFGVPATRTPGSALPAPVEVALPLARAVLGLASPLCGQDRTCHRNQLCTCVGKDFSSKREQTGRGGFANVVTSLYREVGS